MDIILWFHTYKVALAADIEKAFSGRWQRCAQISVGG